jgi:hypothetical protein
MPAFADPPAPSLPSDVPATTSAGSPAPANATPAAADAAPAAASAAPAPTAAPSNGGAAAMTLGDPAATSPAAPNEQTQSAPTAPSDVRTDVPVIGFTHAAFGSRGGKIGAHGFGYGTAASSGGSGGGGLTLYGSPLNRLTLLGTAERRPNGEFAPSASLAVRILGSVEDGWALGAMGTYKAEGFDQLEGELEFGALFSLLQKRWHFDLNAVAGGGLEESEELDAEAKLRVGYDVVDWFRLGIDSRARYRLRGPVALAGGRSGDIVAGAQAIASWSQFYAAILAGPSTVDVASGVGFATSLTAGGMLP